MKNNGGGWVKGGNQEEYGEGVFEVIFLKHIEVRRENGA